MTTLDQEANVLVEIEFSVLSQPQIFCDANSSPKIEDTPVKITQAELEYIGSVTIDEDLMDAANMIENEKVQVLDLHNGERLETYVIKGKRGSGTICINGPAARKMHINDMIIIISYCLLDFEEAKKHKPVLVFPKEGNKL